MRQNLHNKRPATLESRWWAHLSDHTDAIGDDASNLELSQRRAEAVAAIARATRADLVFAVTGYGESQPVAPEGACGGGTSGGTSSYG